MKKIKEMELYVNWHFNNLNYPAGAATCLRHLSHGPIGSIQKGTPATWCLLGRQMGSFKAQIRAVIFKTAPNVVELDVIP